MSPKNLLKGVLCILLLVTSIACDKKDDPGTMQDVQEVRDLKVELSVIASREVKTGLIATKATEPNIYRDGVLVSQGNYTAPDTDLKQMKTTLTHKGRVIITGLIFYKIDEDPTPIEIDIKARLYRDGKLVQDYTQKKTLKDVAVTEQIELYSK